jgi:hypothetical protein
MTAGAKNWRARRKNVKLLFTSMKSTSRWCAFVTTSLALLTSIAHAHPGHFVLDYTAGVPHAGHGEQWGSIALAAILTAAVFVVCRVLRGQQT